MVEAELAEAGIAVTDPVVEWATPIDRVVASDTFDDLDALEDVHLAVPLYADDEDASAEQTGPKQAGEAGSQGDA